MYHCSTQKAKRKPKPDVRKNVILHDSKIDKAEQPALLAVESERESRAALLAVESESRAALLAVESERESRAVELI